MKIHLHQPTVLHRMFFENALLVEKQCILEERMEEADVIVIDDIEELPRVYREEVVIAVLDSRPPYKTPPNVVYVDRRGIAPVLIRLVKEVLEKFVVNDRFVTN